jgi:hypothetical protein
MNGFQYLQPTTAATGSINPRNAKIDHKLTVDHCFAQDLGPSAQLTLLNNASIGVRTDHRYALHLRLDFETGSNASQSIRTSASHPSFRQERLGQTAPDAG